MKKWIIGLILLVSLVAVPVFAQSASATFDWTASGDDGNVGTATTYEMRYRNVAPAAPQDSIAINTWWNLATTVPNMPIPLVAGTAQNVTIPGLLNGVTYWAVIRVADEVPNWSGFSNIALKAIAENIPPARITDLRGR